MKNEELKKERADFTKEFLSLVGVIDRKIEENNFREQAASAANMLYIAKEEMEKAGFSPNEATKLLAEILKGAMK